MRRLAGLLLVFTILVPTPALAQSAADRAGGRQAATDYVEALYQVDSMRVVRSVHPELVKYGYYTRDGAYRGTPMNFTELKQLAASWNKDQKRVDPDTATKEVVVLDVLDKTASAKIVAHWGVDYMHLAKVDGTWMIRQILWQSPPPTNEPTVPLRATNRADDRPPTAGCTAFSRYALLPC
jgi:DNA primase large subunit